MSKKPTIVFACKQNAGRSQIAAALAARHPGVVVLSAGTSPATEVHPQTVATLAEIGLEPYQEPRQLTETTLEEADWVITMGCGETCPIYPGKRYEDWPVADPAGQPAETVRAIREDIATRVADLLARVTQIA